MAASINVRVLMSGLPEFSTRRELLLDGRALSERRFDPDAPAVHLDKLLGDDVG